MRGKNGGATYKQKVFARKYVANGFKGTDAAEEVYNTKNRKNASLVSIQNLKKPLVREEIENILQKAGLGLPEIASKLNRAVNAGLGNKASNADALRGLDMLLKLHSAYPDKITKKLSLSVQQHISSTNGDPSKVLEAVTSQSSKLLTEDL